MGRTDDRYRLMIEHASDVVFTADLEGRLSWVAPAIRKRTGRPAEELIGTPLGDFVLDDDRSPVGEGFQTVMAGGEVEFVGRVTRPDGDPLWVSAIAAPLRDDNGCIIGTVGTVRNIEEVVRARQALAASEEHYRLLAEHTTDVVLRVDPQMRILWVSPSAVPVLGYEPAALVGRRVDELIHPEDWKRYAGERAALTDPTHPSEPARPFVMRARKADGTLLWISSRPSPVVDADGRLVAVVAAWNDVEELVRAREAAQAKQDQLRATLDTVFDPHGLLMPVRDHIGDIVDFRYVEANDAACEDHHLTHDELIGSTIRERSPHEMAAQLVRMLASVVQTGTPLVLDDYEFPDSRVGVPRRRFDVRASRVGECVGQTWRDVTERHEMEAHLSHLATHDPLTGLANRAALLDELERALNSGRRSGRQVAVIMLDLDHFKDVNDEHDHGVGDQLLKLAARRLESDVRGGDLVCRLGGDEFVIVMRDLEDTSEALRVANRVVESFRTPISAAGFELRTTASVGLAVATGATAPEDLVHDADIAMYRAKEAGRDRVSVYNDDLRVAAVARIALEAQLRPALDLGELAVYYQPEVDLLTGRVTAVEALLRWHHPSGELYSAEQFIDVAEEIGVMVESGNWVVREACTRAAAWMRVRPDQPLVLRLNLSKQQLAEHALCAGFEHALLDTGLRPDLVCVEIAESALISPSSTVHENLEGLKRLGVRLAIDNFGTGYAALAFLRERPVDVVKIDRSYIAELDRNEYARRLVAGITALAQQLGLHVAAEGVESMGQVQLLQQLGCTSAQGFLFSAAVPADELLRLLDRTFELT
jgi:diguanylate cyclase (GGDEF)-like protein/PAS domain S-box-containing protein